MEIIYLPKKEIDKKIANLFINKIKKNPRVVLGLATGSSPLGVYKLLVEAYQRGDISFKEVVTFNLDEYRGLDGSHNQSYRYFMNYNLFDHIDIDKKNTHVPSGFVSNNEEAALYDKEIDKYGGIDLQILGLGSDGHIAFNEPGTKFDTLTHITPLTEQTISDNARFFDNIKDVPTEAVTMGLKSIMKAKEIVLIATGSGKKDAIRKLESGIITEDLPCSILHNHKNAIIFVDSDTIPKE